MADLMLSLLILGALFLLCAGVVEGYCALRDRVRTERHEDGWMSEARTR